LTTIFSIYFQSKDKVKFVSGADLQVSEPKIIPYYSKGNPLAETAAPALFRWREIPHHIKSLHVCMEH
jgi:hypothetical protein